MFFNRSLRFRLARQFAVAALMPLILAGLIYALFLEREIARKVDAENLTVVSTLSTQVNLMLDSTASSIRSLAKGLDAIRDDGHVAPRLLDTYAETLEVADALYLIDSQGKVTAVGLPNDGRRGGRENYLGLDFGGRAFVAEAKRRNVQVWSDSFLSVTTGKVAVALAVPMAEGMLVAELGLYPLASQLRDIARHASALPTLIDAKGNVIAAADEDSGVQQRNLGHHLLLDPDRPVKDSAQVYRRDDVQYLGRAVTIPATGWKVISEHRVEEAFAPLRSLRNLLLAVVLAAIALALGLSYLLSDGLSRRFQILSNDVERIAAGDFALPDRHFGWREFDRMANGLCQMAAALVQGRDHLEELVASRTQALRLAVEEAEQANRAKSVFLSNMSHELRTPLNAVIGFSRLMSKSANLSETERRNLEIINRSGNHLLTLINDVLELSKIESGHVVLQEEDTDLGGLIADVADMLGTRAEQAGLTLALKTEGLPAGVRGDAMKLRQILINLLGNAVKFTRQGGVTLTVHGSSAEAERGQARVRLAFAVSDTGIGIAAEDRQKIFEPFVQMVTHATSAGTGLGLTISRQYLRMLGSELAVESTPGEGSTFRFTIDLPVVAAQTGTVPAKGEVTGRPDAGRGKNILIAEDNPDARALLRALLEPLGFTVIEAEDGAAAEAEVERQSPDLVIMDWRMPVMDGLEATRRIRGRAELKQPKIMMLTASAFEEQRQEALAAGVDDYLRKPLQENQLYATLQNLLGVSLLREDAPAVRPAAPVGLSADELAALPGELRDALQQAAGDLNVMRCRELLSELPASDAGLRVRINEMITAYRFRELWTLLTEVNSRPEYSPEGETANCRRDE